MKGEREVTMKTTLMGKTRTDKTSEVEKRNDKTESELRTKKQVVGRERKKIEAGGESV